MGKFFWRFGSMFVKIYEFILFYCVFKITVRLLFTYGVLHVVDDFQRFRLTTVLLLYTSRALKWQ